MSASYRNTKIWHGLPVSGRRRAQADMGPLGGARTKIGTTKIEFSNVPPAQRSPRPDGKPRNPFAS